MLDRIDIDVPAVKFRELRGEAPLETDSSAVIRQRVIQARAPTSTACKREDLFERRDDATDDSQLLPHRLAERKDD